MAILKNDFYSGLYYLNRLYLCLTIAVNKTVAHEALKYTYMKKSTSTILQMHKITKHEI